MSEKVYADEATLTAHLDKLLSTATPTHTPSLYTDTTISASQLITGHTLSNEQLSRVGITALPPLPSPDITKPVDEILAAAFTAIVRLSQCAHANKSLRESAEASLRVSGMRIDELADRLRAAEEKVKKRDAQMTSLRNSFDEAASKHREQIRKLSAESNQLRTRLLHASHRENQLVLATKKKEKEFGQLQSRVHALFKSSATVDQRITRVGTRISPRNDESLESDLRDVGQDRVDVVEGENDVMRGLLQAVQEELDDLILSHGDAASDVSEEFDVPPAPGDDVMGLPLEIIQDDLQQCLEKKFGILRRALESRGLVGEYENEDMEAEDESAAGEVSPDSAHYSVDVMSGNVVAVDVKAEEVDAEAGQVSVEARQVDAGEPAPDPDAGIVDSDADQVREEAERSDQDVSSVDPNVKRQNTGGGAHNVHAVSVDADILSVDAETKPLNTMAVTDSGPAMASTEPAVQSVDRVDDVQGSLESSLKTLSIAALTEQGTERVDSQ